jgi:hypothetical protein
VEPDRARIEKYFTSKFPKWAIFLIVIGVFMLAGPVVLKIVGLLMVVGGGFAIYNSTQVASDAEIDEWTQEDLKKLNKRSLDKLGIDVSELKGEGVIITGPRLSNLGVAKFGFRKGKDNVLRFTPVNSTLINFTQDQLLVYRCALNLLTGLPVNEATDEYFYRDVVSVQTASETANVSLAGTILEGVQCNAAETFKLTTSGGTSVSMVLKDDSLIQKLGGGEIPTTTAERAIQAIRKMLREKKVSLRAKPSFSWRLEGD